MRREADRPILVRGSLRTIEYAVRANGSIPAKDFIEALDDSELRRLDALFRRMANAGRIHNRKQFKQVEGKVYEFKRAQIRLGCFLAGDRWRLTHGFVKKCRRWPKSEITRAKRIMQEDLECDHPTRSKGRQGKR